jgi:subtilisin family serine protease
MRKIIFALTILYTIASSGQTIIGIKTKKNDDIHFEVSKKSIYIGNTDNTSKLNQEKVITTGKNFKIIETTEKEYDDKLKNIRIENTIVEPVLIYKDGTKQICRSEIIIKINPNENLEAILKGIDFSATKNDFIANQYLVKIKNYDTVKIFDLINSLTDDKRIDFVEPNFLRLNILQTTDPYYDSQWSIKNDGYLGGIVDADMDVDDAWNYSTGTGIKVAIIDEGVDLSHPDLSTNLLAGFDATDSNSQGAYSNSDSHGTSCAGIVAAVANNNIGTVGIAYNSKIIPVKVAYKSNVGDWNTNDDWLSNGINWAWQNGADILSNSWGGGSPSTSITNAINNAVTNGRGGKGCVVLFSSGNENKEVAFPATLSNVIAVGASNMFDERKSPQSAYHDECWYNDCHGGSNYGTNLDIIAPGVKISTTNIQGGYTNYFNGTSAACPNAAGVMALILSLKPSLTNTEARQILESSTDKVAGYTYTSGVSGQPNGSWNNEVGYGRINALKAVKAVSPYTLYGSISLCTLPAQAFVGITPTPQAGSIINWSVDSNVLEISGTLPPNTTNASQIY